MKLEPNISLSHLFGEDEKVDYYILHSRATEAGLLHSEFLRLIAHGKTTQTVDEISSPTEYSLRLINKEVQNAL